MSIWCERPCLGTTLRYQSVKQKHHQSGALGHSGQLQKIFQKKELQNRERQKIAKWVTLDQN